MNNPPTSEERIWAVISHLSALAFGMGILLPIIGWSEQRRKSNYASFQCLQALGYQSLGFTIWLLAYLLALIIYVIFWVIVFGSMAESGSKVDVVVGIWMTVLVVLLSIFFGGYLLIPIIAVVACALGRDFRYPIMGKRLARYLGNDPMQTNAEQDGMIEDHEDRWVAAMGHISVIIPLWGILAPLTAWILQGKRSLFLKFQSVQTLAYQAFVTLLFFSAGTVYMFGFVVLMGTVGLGQERTLSGAGMAGLVIFGIAMLVTFGVVLIVPFFHILGQWAGYRVLKGEDYRYPVVGKLVENWISNRNSPPVTAAGA